MSVNLQALKIQSSLTEFIRWKRHYMVYIKLLELDMRLYLPIYWTMDFKEVYKGRGDKDDGNFHNSSKYVREILKEVWFFTCEDSKYPMKTSKPLMKDENAKDDSPFDLKAYTDSDYASASLDRKSTTRGCQFLGSRLISWQCKKQTVVANSTTKAEYVAASSCYGQISISNCKYWNAQSLKCCLDRLMIRMGWKYHMDEIEDYNENIDFDEIMDFLNANPIRYALTVSPTIYVSYIEQFWSTAKTKTVNNETQIRAKVDGKTIVITESSVRRDLHFNDEDDETIHGERRNITKRVVTTASSLEAEQDSGNIIRTQSMATLNSPIPQGTGSGSIPKHQDTILGDIPAQTTFERLSKQSNDSPLSRVNTLGSGEDKITNLKKRVKKLEKKKKLRTSQLKRRLFKVKIKSSVEKSLGDQEDASKQGRNEINQEEGINITTVEPVITASAPVATAGVSVSTAEPSKDQIEYDVDMSKRLQAELDKEVRLERERKEEATRNKFFAAKRYEEKRNKPPTKAEQRKKLYTYMMHMAGYKDKNFKGKSFKAVSKKRVGEKLDEESVKRQKVEDDAEKAELKACLEIVPGDDSANRRQDVL
ncbi:putative ribonuclease H-like domain-containing protein [Tanacetum coccineum]